jgi:hypothetical protein
MGERLIGDRSITPLCVSPPSPSAGVRSAVERCRHDPYGSGVAWLEPRASAGFLSSDGAGFVSPEER